MKHREIQAAHEESVLDSFSVHLSNSGISLDVVQRPDPPDAIVTIDGEMSWIEITDAFQSPDWARSMTSNAADDKVHQPYQRRLICQPDDEACQKVSEAILNKYGKRSMNSLMTLHGPGVLLVGAYTPLTSPEEIIEQAGEAILAEVAYKAPVFKSIYLYRNTPTGHVFAKLL